MDNRIRVKLWAFTEEFKRVTGDDLLFFDLIEKPEELDNYINVAAAQNDSVLNNIVAQLNDLRAKAGVGLVCSTDLNDRGAKKYLRLLDSKLAKGSIDFLDREELDNIASDWGLTVDKKNIIENDLYLSRGNNEGINWEAELARNFRRLFEANGSLNKNKKLKLIDIYVKDGRVSLLTFENILLAEKDKKLLFGPVNTKRSHWSMTIVGAICVAVLSIVIYINSVKNTLNTTVDSAITPTRPAEVIVSGAITFDMTWYAGTTYILSGPVFVEGDSVLTIEPGTQIKGGFGSGLIITKSAKINARGSKDAPIVFTSAKPEGERDRGDWGGLVLLGNAKVNQGISSIEGVAKHDVRGQFGGVNDRDSCGVLEHVRIEFAGLEVFKDNELNGLTMGGCGSETVVNHVQVHRAYDDGIEMFGGNADLKNIVITGARDDSLDWDMGWSGRVQFMIVQQYDDAGDNGFEADNWKDDHNAKPISNPTMYNVTMIGAKNPKKPQRAMNLRRGTAGSFHNFIIMGHTNEFLDIRDRATANLARNGQIQFSHSFVYGVGHDGNVFSDEKDDDNGFVEEAFIRAQESMLFGINPLLFSPQGKGLPNAVPRANSPVKNGLLVSFPEDSFWDGTVDYAGAIEPGTKSNTWLSGWTAYPEN